MSKQKNRTFRLSFIRRRIITLCQSRALRTALLAELHGGPDAALVVDMVEWCPVEMGQWPFGNRLTEEELFNREVEDVLFKLEYYLDAKIEWMDAMEDLENEVPEDDDSDDDASSEDEGYNTSPEVDFEQFDYWALGLNSFLWRIDLYKEGQDGFWTL